MHNFFKPLEKMADLLSLGEKNQTKTSRDWNLCNPIFGELHIWVLVGWLLDDNTVRDVIWVGVYVRTGRARVLKPLVAASLISTHSNPRFLHSMVVGPSASLSSSAFTKRIMTLPVPGTLPPRFGWKERGPGNVDVCINLELYIRLRGGRSLYHQICINCYWQLNPVAGWTPLTCLFDRRLK